MISSVILDQIIEDIVTQGLNKSLEKHSIHPSIFFTQLERTPTLLEAYARALRHRTETLVDKIPDIARETLDPQRARVEIDALKWYASKMEPRKYSERLEIGISQTPDIRAALSEANARIPQPLQVIKSSPHSTSLQSELDALMS